MVGWVSSFIQHGVADVSTWARKNQGSGWPDGNEYQDTTRSELDVGKVNETCGLITADVDSYPNWFLWVICSSYICSRTTSLYQSIHLLFCTLQVRLHDCQFNLYPKTSCILTWTPYMCFDPVVCEAWINVESIVSNTAFWEREMAKNPVGQVGERYQLCKAYFFNFCEAGRSFLFSSDPHFYWYSARISINVTPRVVFLYLSLPIRTNRIRIDLQYIFWKFTNSMHNSWKGKGQIYTLHEPILNTKFIININ